MVDTNVDLIMFSKKKNPSKLDAEQRELYENARKRTKQKKRLLRHFVIFLVGAVVLILINVVVKYKEDFRPLGVEWFVLAIIIWGAIFLVHLLNVFVTSSLMGKEWEQQQMDRLVKKQKERIAQLQVKVEKEYPLPPKKETSADTLNPEKLDRPYNT